MIRGRRWLDISRASWREGSRRLSWLGCSILRSGGTRLGTGKEIPLKARPRRGRHEKRVDVTETKHPVPARRPVFAGPPGRTRCGPASRPGWNAIPPRFRSRAAFRRCTGAPIHFSGDPPPTLRYSTEPLAFPTIMATPWGRSAADEVPGVFWGVAGVHSASPGDRKRRGIPIFRRSRHSPGCMLVTDMPNSRLAAWVARKPRGWRERIHRLLGDRRDSYSTWAALRWAVTFCGNVILSSSIGVPPVCSRRIFRRPPPRCGRRSNWRRLRSE